MSLARCILSRLACRPLVLTLAASLIGCSGKPSAVKAPPINPAEAVQAILSQYDKNGDSQLSHDELSSCAALANAKGRYDENDDDQVSDAELTKRFEGWASSGLGISSLACRVIWKGRPLAGAEIKFDPEDCFRGALQPATGTTDESGTAMLSIPADHLPADAHNMRGVQQGLYRVAIDHPEVKIPAKYNSETELGKEVSFELGENFVSFSL